MLAEGANWGFVKDVAVLCDDIRREDNGKALLIGVYTGDIVVPTGNVTLALSLWIQGRAKESAHEFALKIEGLGTDPILEKELSRIGTQSVAMAVSPGDIFNILIGKILVPVQHPGELLIGLRFGTRDWAEVLRKKVIIREFSTETP